MQKFIFIAHRISLATILFITVSCAANKPVSQDLKLFPTEGPAMNYDSKARFFPSTNDVYRLIYDWYAHWDHQYDKSSYLKFFSPNFSIKLKDGHFTTVEQFNEFYTSYMDATVAFSSNEIKSIDIEKTSSGYRVNVKVIKVCKKYNGKTMSMELDQTFLLEAVARTVTYGKNTNHSFYELKIKTLDTIWQFVK